MLNAVAEQVRRYDMLAPGDTVTCAVSGGADSMALLWAMYLLREKFSLSLQAVHFNHQLRGEEARREEAFVREFCRRFDIPLTVGTAKVTGGEKGLEAAAREARYAFFETLPGRIATAHTADDNAETVLMHLVRGTRLKGLGGIAPVRGKFIRPMLTVTRQQVLAFLQEYHIGFMEDSSNLEDGFLRNRLRHHVMPLLKAENPRFSQNVSEMAMDLRVEEAALSRLAEWETLPGVSALREMDGAVRSRILEGFLKKNGVKEPEKSHIALAQRLVFSENPSAQARFPGGVTLRRCYDALEAVESVPPPRPVKLRQGMAVQFGAYRILCLPAQTLEQSDRVFTVVPQGELLVRSRKEGDRLKLAGGTKTLKKRFVDQKIPAGERPFVPVIADEKGILAVCGLGADVTRRAETLPAVQIRIDIEK